LYQTGFQAQRLKFSECVLTTQKMAKHPTNMNSDVTGFLDEQKHPFRKEIEQLRICILNANNALVESIKWNGPNYSVANEDRITMRIQPPIKQAQLIFHRGAKKKVQPTEKLISNKSKMLVWKENDRAVATFKNIEDIENGNVELTEIIKEWVSAAE
jgi:hypothetical protein